MASRLLYVATREPTYSRVAIVENSLRENFEVTTITSNLRHYPMRIAAIIWKLLVAKFSGQLRKTDAIFIGFMAQPVIPFVRILWRGKLISDAYFSLYDTFVNDKVRTTPGSCSARICEWLDQYMLQSSDLCLTATIEHANYFREKFDVPGAKLERLWVSANESTVPRNTLWPNNDKPFRVFFWGNYIPLQGVPTIVAAADQLKHENIEFTLTGRGQTFDTCQAMISERNVTNVQLIDWMTPAEIHKQVSLSHLALGIFGTSAKAARVIPNKVFQALAMKIPVITRNSPGAAELLQDKLDAYFVPAGNASALAAKILWVRENYYQAITCANNGWQTFTDVAAPSCITRTLCDHLQQLGLVPLNPIRTDSQVIERRTTAVTVS